MCMGCQAKSTQYVNYRINSQNRKRECSGTVPLHSLGEVLGLTFGSAAAEGHQADAQAADDAQACAGGEGADLHMYLSFREGRMAYNGIIHPKMEHFTMTFSKYLVPKTM